MNHAAAARATHGEIVGPESTQVREFMCPPNKCGYGYTTYLNHFMVLIDRAVRTISLIYSARLSEKNIVVLWVLMAVQ